MQQRLGVAGRLLETRARHRVAQVLEAALSGMPETALRLDAAGQAERVRVQRLAPGDRVDLPQVESVRSARRAGPNGQIVFDLVAEITQAMHVAPGGQGPGFTHHGGCTVILSPVGAVRYVIVKNVLGEGRMARRRAFLGSEMAQRYWVRQGDRMAPRSGLFMLLHESPPQGPAAQGAAR